MSQPVRELLERFFMREDGRNKGFLKVGAEAIELVDTLEAEIDSEFTQIIQNNVESQVFKITQVIRENEATMILELERSKKTHQIIQERNKKLHDENEKLTRRLKYERNSNTLRSADDIINAIRMIGIPTKYEMEPITYVEDDKIVVAETTYSLSYVLEQKEKEITWLKSIVENLSHGS